jgi:hypothetical protein
VRLVRTAVIHVEVAVWLLASTRLLHRRGLDVALHRLGDRQVGWGQRIRADELVAAAGRVQRLVGRRTCLEEAVALVTLLARHGRPAELVVGCRRDGTAWLAHAWTIADGARFDQQPAAEHTELARYTAAGNWEGQPAA